MEAAHGITNTVRGVEEAVEAVNQNFEPFELQPSIIDAVVDTCPEHEAEEIWRVVGHSLVEQARDLLEEAKILLEIWRQLKEDADHATSRDVHATLPEPPMVRERLIQEIRFLADHLRGKAGRDRNREILNYALATADQHGSGFSRPQSAVSSRDGRDTPLRLGTSTPSSMDGSQTSVLSGRVSTEHVSLTDIDSSVTYLREALEEEIAQRKEDIIFLQECTEGESDHLQVSTRPQPSLRELREFGTQLEKEVLSRTRREECVSSSTSQTTPRPPPGKCPGRKHMSSAGVRRASGVKLRMASTTHSNSLVQEKPISNPPLGDTQPSTGRELLGSNHRISTALISSSGKQIT